MTIERNPSPRSEQDRGGDPRSKFGTHFTDHDHHQAEDGWHRRSQVVIGRWVATMALHDGQEIFE